ncbi:hypothetical protein [Actinomadura sp. 9N215]|uniref:hypothetical protein n=1 Tax=Actinomadura sp. 9N215 TaxID=3375150 RepID=UPI003799FE74
MLGLAEEAGEFVGAYRRAAGMARRTGGWDQVRDELADVAITAHVTANVLDAPIEPHPTSPGVEDRTGLDPGRAVLEVAAAAGWVADVHLDSDARFALGAALDGVLAAAQRAAYVLNIDLDAAVGAKAEVICSRGWRDQPTTAATTATAVTEIDGGRQWAEAMLDAADALSYAIETSTHDTTRFQRAHQVLFGTPQNTPDDAPDDAPGDDAPSCQPATGQETVR